ncbi:hypothetical protein COW36_10785 [bacterium (Candidatus Blackallbacteria) CG17_big_fil_post_rev_8_21_14_2_50_48_46]|uniref:Uncharacterized protein n=1 Tax=bacterium (Candidatus Blackallbacteria) CG17_big_fil_post_rev_8_21_14_2_50_48_46 TaxID=2014261 RepID=A0A2M7G4U3_9BACT|nr:MAG: hypothetical protein COW64_20535 [bacterium (Candidatus Blackallbacteria) CG18_big_fil_WC_8_21_14_2_50_49_26]PIW16953.1 MAG: hypothetical protein COW36_10785 [bacterium (Candidatus Blackallbacteria) CG17_big_fil_post_rev_8_21_14_2_50_48_46]PIW50232.1 MAG: hypothetical protein COW20_03300 [bacterium (Candidatus Blackallbacteria) CG13_big_fil_rev_8_21_14_2_50_49_14]
MRIKHLPALALSLYLLLQTQAFAFAPGQDILAQKDDGNWYIAWVIREEAGQVLVAYNWSANEMEWLPSERIRENQRAPKADAEKWISGWNSSEGSLWALAISADGKWAAVAAAAGYIQTFEQPNLYPLQKLPGNQKPIRALAFSPDSQSLASCDDGGQISIYQTGQWKLLQRKQVSGSCNTLAFSKQGVLALAGYTAQKNPTQALWLYDLNSQKLSAPLVPKPSQERVISSLSFDPSGEFLALGSSNQLKGIELFSVSNLSLKALRKLPSAGDISTLAFSPDGKYLAAGGTEQKLMLWNWRSGQRFWATPWRSGKEQYITNLDFSPDGSQIAVCGMGSGEPVQIFRTGNGKHVKSLGKKTSMNCTGLRFTQDNQSLLTIRQVYSNFFELILDRYRLKPNRTGETQP